MTEILDLKPTLASQPVIIRAIRFDPWPFEDEEVNLNDDALWIDSTGEPVTYADNGGNATLSMLYENVLVILSDGRIAASSEQGVRAYGRPSPP